MEQYGNDKELQNKYGKDFSDDDLKALIKKAAN